MDLTLSKEELQPQLEIWRQSSSKVRYSVMTNMKLNLYRSKAILPKKQPVWQLSMHMPTGGQAKIQNLTVNLREVKLEHSLPNLPSYH